MNRPLYVGRFRVDITVRDGVSVPLALAKLARGVAAAADTAGAPEPASIGLILSSDIELARLNQAHLDMPGPTDVLSFPLLPPEVFTEHGDVGLQERQGPSPFPLPPGHRVHLGDIVISVERAIAQAVEGRGGHTGEVRWSPADELLLLATHGTLHLCGWDHAEPVEEAAMRSLERRLLGVSEAAPI